MTRTELARELRKCLGIVARAGMTVSYPFEAKEDEKHIHPLQLDVIERCLVLWSNPVEVCFTPFMGVGSEVYGAVINGRKGIGVELKETYYRQAVKNLADARRQSENGELFTDV